MTQLPEHYSRSTDRTAMDRERIHSWLSEEAYWAIGRSRERTELAIDNSWNFGIFDETGAQRAYARIITDRVTFAWLCDVFVDEDARGSGLGKALVEFVLDELEPLHLKRIMLTTVDAHGLYRQFGFAPPADPAGMLTLLGGPN